MNNTCLSLSMVQLYKVTLSVYSKLGTSRTFEEVLYVSASRDTRHDKIERAARNYCYQNSLTPSSVNVCPVADMPAFEIAEVDAALIERGSPLLAKASS